MSGLSSREIQAIEPIFSWKANRVGKDWWSSDAKLYLEKTIAASIVLGTPYLGILFLAMGLNYVKEGSPVLYKNRLSHPRYGDVSHLKIRTMVVGSEINEEEIIEKHGQLHDKNWIDSRTTNFGRPLRRTSLDEFPQILTGVLCGKEHMVSFRMAGKTEHEKLIYPNSHCDPYKKHLANQNDGLRSGMLSLAAIIDRDANIEKRLAYDNYWSDHCTIWSDLALIAMTAQVPFKRNGR